MKIFSQKSAIFAGLISTTHGKKSPRYKNAAEGLSNIFQKFPDDFWQQTYVEEAVKETYPKFWQKWIERKSGQFHKLGQAAERPYQRCGTDKRYFLWQNAYISASIVD